MWKRVIFKDNWKECIIASISRSLKYKSFLSIKYNRKNSQSIPSRTRNRTIYTGSTSMWWIKHCIRTCMADKKGGTDSKNWCYYQKLRMWGGLKADIIHWKLRLASNYLWKQWIFKSLSLEKVFDVLKPSFFLMLAQHASMKGPEIISSILPQLAREVNSLSPIF